MVLFLKTLIPFTCGCFARSLVEIGLLVLENISKLYKCIYYVPLEKDGRGESPSPEDALCHIWLKPVPLVVLEISSMYFHYFVALHLNKLEYLKPNEIRLKWAQWDWRSRF